MDAQDLPPIRANRGFKPCFSPISWFGAKTRKYIRRWCRSSYTMSIRFKAWPTPQLSRAGVRPPQEVGSADRDARAQQPPRCRSYSWQGPQVFAPTSSRIAPTSAPSRGWWARGHQDHDHQSPRDGRRPGWRHRSCSRLVGTVDSAGYREVDSSARAMARDIEIASSKGIVKRLQDEGDGYTADSEGEDSLDEC